MTRLLSCWRYSSSWLLMVTSMACAIVCEGRSDQAHMERTVACLLVTTTRMWLTFARRLYRKVPVRRVPGSIRTMSSLRSHKRTRFAKMRKKTLRIGNEQAGGGSAPAGLVYTRFSDFLTFAVRNEGCERFVMHGGAASRRSLMRALI